MATWDYGTSDSALKIPRTHTHRLYNWLFQVVYSNIKGYIGENPTDSHRCRFHDKLTAVQQRQLNFNIFQFGCHLHPLYLTDNTNHSPNDLTGNHKPKNITHHYMFVVDVPLLVGTSLKSTGQKLHLHPEVWRNLYGPPMKLISLPRIPSMLPCLPHMLFIYKKAVDCTDHAIQNP